MGRSLPYAIYDDLKNYRSAEREIRIATELLNYRFTWTCEKPFLDRLNEREILRHERASKSKLWQPLPIAYGLTKVAGDEWNAVLLTRYVAWLSRRLPDAKVTIRDEGDYLTPGCQILRNGVPELDHERLAESRTYLEKHDMREYIELQREQIEAFGRGETHRSVAAKEYADRREIRALGLPEEALARMTLDEVADMIAFPWTTEGLGAA
jgi:hypothetical protein